MAEKSYKEEVSDLIKVMQAFLDGEPIQRKRLNPGGEPYEWRDVSTEVMEMDGFETEYYEYRIKPTKGGRLKVYPDEKSIYPEDFTKLREGRVYFIRNKARTGREERGYVFIKKIYPYDDVIESFYTIIQETRGTKVFIADRDADAYHSVASDECCNFIYESVGFNGIDQYDYYVPSKSQVQEADDFIRRLGYEFKDGEMVKL